MTTIQAIESTSILPSPTSTGDSRGNNEIEFDPAFKSTYTFDPTHPATEFKDSYGTPGTDLSTQTYLMLDGMVNNPYNTTDAQLFFIFTSNLVSTGAIDHYAYNIGTAENPEYLSLDQVLSGIIVTDPITHEETPLMACLVDVVIQEKYASEVAAGNTDWDPTVDYTGEGSFCDTLSAMFPGDSEVSQQVNAEIAMYETGGQWTSYTSENGQQPGETNEEYAARLRADTSEQWAGDVNNSNMVQQESVMREAMVHDTGVTGGLMASLMLLYMLLEAMGYSALFTLTDQVNWYQHRTDNLTELSSEWQNSFDSPDDAYAFVGNVEAFVNEVNGSPQYADSSLITTVNSSLGQGGFLGMDTGYYYYDSSTNTYKQANIDYLYNNPDTEYYNGNTDSGYCDANGNEYTYASLYKTNQSNSNTILYEKNEAGTIVPALRPDYSYSSSYYSSTGNQPTTFVLITGYVMTYEVHQPDDYVIYPSSDYSNGSNPNGTIYPEKVYDKEGNQLTWGELESMDPNTVLYAQPGGVYTLGYYNYSWQNLDSKGKSTGGSWSQQGNINIINAGYMQNNFNPAATEDGKTALYDTFDSWSLDPSGGVEPAPQYGLVQGDFNESDTGFTNAAGTSTTLENQTSNWIQEVESAMSKAISTYIDAINTLIDNQTVQ